MISSRYDGSVTQAVIALGYPREDVENAIAERLKASFCFLLVVVAQSHKLPSQTDYMNIAASFLHSKPLSKLQTYFSFYATQSGFLTMTVTNHSIPNHDCHKSLVPLFNVRSLDSRTLKCIHCSC